MTERRADVVAAFVVGAAIVAAAFGSAIQRDLFHAGRPARWLLLAALLVVAAWRAWLGRREWRFRRVPAALVGVFLVLSLVSAGWSAAAWSTLGRGAAQAAVVVAAALLAGCAASRPALAHALAEAIAAAVAVVAVGSALFWLVHPSGFFGAVQAATTQYPARFRGLEFNPNTLAMLLAVGMPLALALAVEGGGRAARRVLASSLLAVLIVEIVASGSRGGLLAGFGACIVTALALPLARTRRLALATGVIVVALVAAWASTIPKALPATHPAPAPAATVRTRGIDAERVLPLDAEIGNPWWTHRSETSAVHRAFFNTSVRREALVGSIHRWLERPLVGWGYGAEIHAFVNRYYGYDSQNPENGYVGILLQLGIVGLIVFVAALASCVVPAVRACLSRADGVAAGVLGAAAAGILIGLSQSYFHGPGGIVFVAFWTSLMLAGVVGLSPARGPRAG